MATVIIEDWSNEQNIYIYKHSDSKNVEFNINSVLGKYQKANINA